MIKMREQLLLTFLAALCLIGLHTRATAGSVSLDCSPREATANSIWNFYSIWKDEKGRWPNANLNDPAYEEFVDYNPTIGLLRPSLLLSSGTGGNGGGDVSNYAWDPNYQLNLPVSYVGFAGTDDNDNKYQPLGYVSLQPDPASTIRLETSTDARFDHGLDLIPEVHLTIPKSVPFRQEVDISPTGDIWIKPLDMSGKQLEDENGNLLIQLAPAYVPARDAIQASPAGEGGDPPAVVARPATKAVIVLNPAPVWLVGVWADAAHTRPVGVKRVLASTIYPKNGDDPGWPPVPVLEISDPGKLADEGVKNLYIEYFGAGTHYVAVQHAPLPMPYTAYKFPVPHDITDPPVTDIRINDGIVKLDPNRPDPNDPVNSGILGIFDNPDLSAAANQGGASYFTPGDYEPAPGGGNRPHRNASLLKLSNLPAGGLSPDAQNLYVQVSTNSVDGVYLDPDEKSENYYTGGVYDSKQGIIRLGKPLSDPVLNEVGYLEGVPCYVTYRPLSHTSLTLGKPVVTAVPKDWGITPYPDAEYTYDSKNCFIDPSTGRLTLLDKDVLPASTFAVSVQYSVMDPAVYPQGIVWINGLPGHYVTGTPAGGALYRVAGTAGLNMSNSKQWPSVHRWDFNVPANDNHLIYDPYYWPIYYVPLRAYLGSPTLFDGYAIGYYRDENGEIKYYEQTINALNTVHDSRPQAPGDMIDYAGIRADRDWLTCYPDGRWPSSPDIDPLTIEPLDITNSQTPDDASSSAQFVFRVRYHNLDGTNVLPPRPWLGAYADPESGMPPTGVVVYLEQAPGQFRPHFMYLENPWAAPGAPDYDVYIYRVMPHNAVDITGYYTGFPFKTRYSNYLGSIYDNYAYESLASGVYHYYFACSDDSMQFDDGKYPFDYQSTDGKLEWANDPQWGNTSSTGLDPTLARHVEGYQEVARVAGRKYTLDNNTPIDTTLYVDRPTRTPHYMEGDRSADWQYPIDSQKHPVITCQLGVSKYDDKWLRWDDISHGTGRFMGTLADYVSAVNPMMIGSHTLGRSAIIAETTGSTTKKDNVFRVFYSQKDNKPPIYIRLYVNNASEKTSPTGATPDQLAAHNYTTYTMYERQDQVFPDPNNKFINGVWYEYKTKLPAGPHTYYFEAYDGEHLARFPIRPDHYHYGLATIDGSYNRSVRDPEDIFDLYDFWVPTDSLANQRGTAGYIDNDYFPGPYVNNPCALSDSSVTPGTGKEGQEFIYRVKYSDPDGQRPYSAKCILQINDRGDTRTFDMTAETPVVLPAPGDADYENKWQAVIQQYQQGVYYILKVSTTDSQAFQQGIRRYRFEFVDDWGRQSDTNDRRQGELTMLPAGADNWIDGPVISGNVAPTLTEGVVDSADKTSNAASLWTFRVKYRDINNDQPQLVKVYIGLLQSDGKTILWDDGHDMQLDTGDTSKKPIYSDGVYYHFQTRLGAVSAVDTSVEPTPEPKQYYYAFEAYDGLAWATYKSSADPEIRSDAAGAMVYNDVQWVEDPNDPTSFKTYKVVPLVVQQASLMSNGIAPSNPKDIVRVAGVYDNQDLSGPSYYNPSADNTPFRPGAATINLSSALPVGTFVYINYLAKDKTIVKPTASNGVVTSATVVAPDPAILPNIERVIRVYTAANTDQPDANYYQPYVLLALNAGITPPAGTDKLWVKYEAESPIVGPLPVSLPAPAGVMPDIELYRNAGSAATPILLDDVKNGWISDTDSSIGTVLSMRGLALFANNPTLEYATPDDASRIASVEGVYLNSDLSGPNYFRPEDLNTPILRVAKLDPDNPQIIRPLSKEEIAQLPDDEVPYDPEEVVKVFGVYDDKSMSGTNYLIPDLTQLDANGSDIVWQEARTVARGTVWPTNPNDIIAVRGIWPNPIEERSGLGGIDFGNALNYYDPTDTTGITDGVGTAVDANTVRFVDRLPVRRIVGVYTADDPNTNYYEVANPDEYDGEHNLPPMSLVLTQPLPADKDGNLPANVVIRYERLPFPFGRYHEYLPLTKFLPVPTAGTYYISYYPAQTLNNGVLQLPVAPAGPYVYVKIWAKAFKPGNSVIKLTRDLPLISQQAAVTSRTVVTPSNAGDIGYVDGIYDKEDLTGTNYYLDSAGNVPNPWDPLRKATAIGLGQQLPAGVTNVWVSYVPLNRRVYIKYSDIRFTHQLRGASHQIVGARNENVSVGTSQSQGGTSTGSTHYSPDGWNITTPSGLPYPFVPIKPNQAEDNSIIDITGGVIGVWKNADGTGTNYFDPRQTTLYKNDFKPREAVLFPNGFDENGQPVYTAQDHLLMHLRLSQQTEDATTDLWARFYQKGEYHIDRYNRDITFFSASQKATDRIQASYFFGTKMPQLLMANTPPELTAGSVSPYNGSRSTQYVYTVTYKDVDGPNGQAPAYVRVYIDGQMYDMTPVNKGSIPPYRDGAVYTYTATTLVGGSHKYRFEASDGIAVAWFDAIPDTPATPHRSKVGVVPKTVVDIDGPWVNNVPLLDKPADPILTVNPDPAKGSVSTDTAITFNAFYQDPDGDEPFFLDPINDLDLNKAPVLDGDLVSGSPRIWIDSKNGDAVVTGVVAALASDPLETTKLRTIKVAGNPGWTADQFAGLLMQIIDGGPATGRIYLIQSNTANELVVAVDDLAADKLPVQSRFRINGLVMTKMNPADTDFVKGIVYQLQVPKLAVGDHKFHFTARSREYKPLWLRKLMTPANEAKWPYSDEVRYPLTDNLTGPTVVATAPQGNTKPTLSAAISTTPATLWRGPKSQSAVVDTTDAQRKTVAISFQNSLRKVLGVYTTDKLDTANAPDNLNYYQPATAADEWKSGNSIKLTTALPGSATTVYVKYYGIAPADGIYKSGEALTYKVNYMDPDGDAPTYHNSVQGYVRLVFNDTGLTVPMVAETPTPPTGEDYKKGVWFVTTQTTTPEGIHKYHFESSDGWHAVRFPEGNISSPTANDYLIKVNYKPILTDATVDRTSGATLFRFSATYKDQDGNAPVQIALKLQKDGAANALDPITMQVDPANTNRNYVTGVAYYADVMGLDPGLYHSTFVASDATQDADSVAGPDINVRTSNSKPIINSYDVTPQAGKTTDSFVFTATYKDIEGDAPMASLDNSKVRQNGLILTIDPGTATEQHFIMSRATEGTADYTQPVSYSKTLPGKQIGPGRHNYSVSASDGELSSVLAGGLPVSKPVTIKVPYFDLGISAKDGSNLTDRAVVGQEVFLIGKMYFPYVESGAPNSINNVTVKVTKPDGTPLSLPGSVSNIDKDDPSDPKNWVGDIQVRYDGLNDQALVTKTSLTLTASGQWAVSATWPGDSSWDKTETTSSTNMNDRNHSVLLTVSGPARTIAVASPENPENSAPVTDMICPPMIIGSPNAGDIFGQDRALEMRIIIWNPASKAYFRYGVSGLFPALRPGDAMWIKPRKYDNNTHTGYPAAEPLGLPAVMSVGVTDLRTIYLPQRDGGWDYIAAVRGVYLSSDKSGINYYDPSSVSDSANLFRHGQGAITLTRPLGAGTSAVWVDYVDYPFTAVDDGWISLDNPAVARAIDGTMEPRYLHTNYRLIKSLAQAYPPKTDSAGQIVEDPATKLPMLKPCLISLKTGWNQFGNIFFNWKKSSQTGYVAAGDTGKVTPSQRDAIGRVLGVYLNPQFSEPNYYRPGAANQDQVFHRSDNVINLTSPLPVGTSAVYIKYEAYPREDVGIPIGDCHVIYLGERKTLAEAKVAGWISDYGWRYDPIRREYVQVSATAVGAERVLKTWSGYWIKAYVDCQFEIDPNTSYNGGDPGTGSTTAGLARELTATERMEMPPAMPTESE